MDKVLFNIVLHSALKITVYDSSVDMTSSSNETDLQGRGAQTVDYFSDLITFSPNPALSVRRSRDSC